MPKEENPQGFVRTKLPWMIAGGALLVFVLTINHWVNLRSLPVAGKITGWDWTLPVQWPLFYTLTYPFRFLPAGIQPLALNLFTAVCAALTLGLLARSVALLPHDRTHEQRTRERSEFSLLSIKLAWVPPLLAVLVCGLQLTFWEHATAVTGEMVDLLLFAYVIRCLLEYRVSHQERWLSKLAFVYGLGVTNNWAMIGFFPLFLIAIIWIKGVRFFDPGFLVRMAGLGIAGLLLYLLLPMVWMFKSAEEFSFFQVLQTNWTNQKTYLVDTRLLRNRALLLSLTSLLPALLMGIRWPSSFGDTSAAGETLTNLAFRINHLFFLGACLYVAFDPNYSPRKLGMGVSFLTFYYVAALAVGYYCGYALLVFTDAPRKGWKRDEALGRFFNPLVRGVILAVLVAVPIGLAYKNFPAIRASNGSILREFVGRTTQALPQHAAYLLSDDPYQLALVQASLDSRAEKNDHVLVNTRSLEFPAYHQALRKRYGTRWPLAFEPDELPARVGQQDIQGMIQNLAASNSVIYLHPSFGYFFEVVYPEPNGQIYPLKNFAADQILPPPLTPEQIQANASFWNEPVEYLQKIEKFQTEEAADAMYVAQFYSRALNTWGVFQQRAGDLAAAGKQFARAYELSTNNVPARFNRDFNQAAQAGNFASTFNVTEADELLGAFKSWDELIARNGPIDRPDLCLMLGQILISQSQYRQAALQFSRTVAFQPTNFTARLGIARSLVLGNWNEQGLAEVEKIADEFRDLPPREIGEIAALRAAAYFGQNNFAKAEETLQNARTAQPNEPMLTDSLVELYRATGRFTNALELLEEQIRSKPTNILARLQKAELLLGREDFEAAHSTLDSLLAVAPGQPSALLFHAFAYIQEKKHDEALIRIAQVLQMDPDNTQALIYKGIVHMEQEDFDKGRAAFDAALKKDPANVTVLRNRAILNMRSKRWSDAKEDYEALRKIAPKSHAVLYGLGEVAYNQKDHEAAERYYTSYLKYAPEGGTAELEEEKKKVQARLQELKTTNK
jgi:tetratricopeptide (TPR) repeat protein